MNLVGRYEALKTSVSADQLQGDCAGATHFIYGVSVGAFDFYAGADATIGAAAGVAGIGAGGQSQATRETLTKNGDPDACAKATSTDKSPPEGCGALIRIEVVPIGEAKAVAPTCPDGTRWDGSQCLGTASASGSPPPQASATAPFDRATTSAVLGAITAAVVSCKKDGGPTGDGHVSLTFNPDGTVASAMIDQPPFAGTAVGGCVAGKFRGAHVPAFSGGPLTVGKRFTIPQ